MKGKKIILLTLFLIFAGVGIYLWTQDETSYAIYSGIISLFSITMYFASFNKIEEPEVKYKREVNDILKTYDPILIEVENLPELKDKNIVKTLSFKDIVNAEYEYRKPVYYVHNDTSYDFILINKDDADTFTLKEKEENNSIL